eukprot:6214359-Pleurochrysis_carterae.AAC.2
MIRKWTSSRLEQLLQEQSDVLEYTQKEDGARLFCFDPMLKHLVTRHAVERASVRKARARDTHAHTRTQTTALCLLALFVKEQSNSYCFEYTRSKCPPLFQLTARPFSREHFV